MADGFSGGGTTTVSGNSGAITTPFQNQTSSVSLSQSSGLGLASLAGILVDVVAVLILMGVVGLLVIVVVANRADPDPSGHRPLAVYYFAVSFITITVAIIGSAAVVSAPLRLIGHHSGSLTNSMARTVVAGGLITAVSLLLLLTHLRNGLALTRGDADSAGPSRRVGQSYVSAVSFVAILALLVIIVLSIYLLFALGAPGVFGSFGGRSSVLRVLIEALYLGLLAFAVLWSHHDLVPPGLDVFNGHRRSTTPVPT